MKFFYLILIIGLAFVASTIFADDFCFQGKTDYRLSVYDTWYPRSLAPVDLDGINGPDLAVLAATEYLNSRVIILRNNGNGTYPDVGSSDILYINGQNPRFITAANVDSDNDIDLLISNDLGISMARNIGNGTFQEEALFNLVTSVYCIATADFDGDGYNDAAGVVGSDITILLNENQNGIFEESLVNHSLGGNPFFTFLCVGDFDDDNDIDIATVANYSLVSDKVAIWKNNGLGEFSFFSEVNLGLSGLTYNGLSITSADYNNDNIPDLAVANDYFDNISVLINNGSGVFNVNGTYAVNNAPKSIVSTDYNGDGANDLAIANEYNHVNVLLNQNNGTGSFTFFEEYNVGVGPKCIVSSDIDGNNRQDIITTNGDANGDANDHVTILFNRDQCYDPLDPVNVPGDYATIQGAINAIEDGMDIIVASGTYTESNINFSGKDIDISSQDGASSTIIDLAGQQSRAFIFNHRESYMASVGGFTIRNSNISMHSSTDSYGGAIRIFEASPTIYDCVFENCQADIGGAIEIRGYSGVKAKPYIYDCVFRSNSAVNNRGGAIALHNDAEPVMIDNCTFESNTATYSGGAIYIDVSSNLVGLSITDCVFNSNSSDDLGGAISSNDPCEISRNTFYDNGATIDGGGSIYFSGSDLALTRNIIANSSEGGGLETASGATVTFACNDFWNNTGGDIGGEHSPADVDANTIFLNPYFCDIANGDFLIVDNSPCAPENSPCGQLIGKYGVGCSGPNVIATTPLQNEVDINKNMLIMADFDVPMDEATITLDNVLLSGEYSGSYEGNLVYLPLSKQANFDTNNPFLEGELINIILTDDITDENGFPIDNYIGQFVVEVNEDNSGIYAPHIMTIAGNRPKSIAVADYNGDSHLDLAILNFLSDNLMIFVGAGDGSFTQAATYSTEIYPWGVASADFDSDGDMDLAVSNGSSDNVKVWFNSGGTFSGATLYSVGENPHTIITADFNADGAPDLATANLDSDDASILLNNGNGTFANHVAYPLPNGPLSATSGDLDHDGDLDLFVGSYYDDKLTVYYNNGDGTFESPFEIAIDDGPFAVVAGDLDDDGDLDLATANRGSHNVSIILYDINTGTFAAPVTYVSGNEPYHLCIGDLDGDNDLDLAVANLNSNNVALLFNNGDGTFPVRRDEAVGSLPLWVVDADLNNDGRLDLIVTDFYSNAFSVLLNEYIPNAPVLVLPTDGYSTYSHSITLDWDDYSGAISYEVVVDTDPAFGSIDRTQIDLIPSQWLISPNLGHGKYYWKVRAQTATGTSDWSYIWDFTIKSDPPPSCPVLYTYDGSEFVMENPLLTECEKSGYVDIVTDYYQISHDPSVESGFVTFQLRELENEISTIYDLELITVDHDVDTKIACDAFGEIKLYKDIFEPISAIDNNGENQLDLVRSADELFFESSLSGWIEVEFIRISGDNTTGINMVAPPKKFCPDPDPTHPKISPISKEDEPDIQLNVEYMDNHGNWIEHSSIPPRTNLKQEYLFIENSNDTETLKVRISWDGPYTVDAIHQFTPFNAVINKTTLKIENGRLVRAEETSDFESSTLTTDNPIELNIGDVYEFSFQTHPIEDESMIREYLIKAVGRYQPDYSVFTHLLPGKAQLHGNFPNPFNPITTISYTLATEGHVKLEVFNVLGQRVVSLVDEHQEVGKHEIYWDSKDENGSTVASGIYIYRMTTDDMTANRKMVLLK